MVGKVAVASTIGVGKAAAVKGLAVAMGGSAATAVGNAAAVAAAWAMAALACAWLLFPLQNRNIVSRPSLTGLLLDNSKGQEEGEEDTGSSQLCCSPAAGSLATLPNVMCLCQCHVSAADQA